LVTGALTPTVPAVRIGIIGGGSLGRAIAVRFSAQGHEIMFGGHGSAESAAREVRAQAGSNADAARFGELVILAVPFAEIGVALKEAGSLEGRVLWSCVNALGPDGSGLMIGFVTSAAEEVAEHAQDAKVVAAIPPFASAIAAGSLQYDSGLEPSVFVCGDDQQAKRLVEGLVTELGAHPVDAGPLTAARLVEPAMMLAVRLAYAGATRDVGLRLLERGGASAVSAKSQSR
jgi:predicted dinucleotide-binding enzyme